MNKLTKKDKDWILSLLKGNLKLKKICLYVNPKNPQYVAEIKYVQSLI